jgi:hypothetical protein
MEGVNNTSGSMTFSFSTPVSAVGGLINWSTGTPEFATIAVYNSADQLIESQTLWNGISNLLTPDSFYGFSENSSDIAFFVLSGDYIGIKDLTVPDQDPLVEKPYWLARHGHLLQRRYSEDQLTKKAALQRPLQILFAAFVCSSCGLLPLSAPAEQT